MRLPHRRYPLVSGLALIVLLGCTDRRNERGASPTEPSAELEVLGINFVNAPSFVRLRADSIPGRLLLDGQLYAPTPRGDETLSARTSAPGELESARSGARGG